MAKIDFNSVESGAFGHLYGREGKSGVKRLLTHEESQAYRKWLKTGNRVSRRVKPPSQKFLNKYFTHGLRTTNRSGHVLGWMRPLTIKGAKNGLGGNYDWQPRKYVKPDGSVRFDSKRRHWGVDVTRHKAGASVEGAVLNGSKEWIRHIQIAMHQLRISGESFRIMLGHRALKVFQNSFKYQSFNGRKWAPLAPYTIKKRRKRGTGVKILREYGDMFRLMTLSTQFGGGIIRRSRIFTERVPANPGHHKKHTLCYAGFHNEGKGTYGKSTKNHIAKRYIQRRFMGHTSKLDPFVDPFVRKMMKLYLFDSVFLIQKRVQMEGRFV